MNSGSIPNMFLIKDDDLKKKLFKFSFHDSSFSANLATMGPDAMSQLDWPT